MQIKEDRGGRNASALKLCCTKELVSKRKPLSQYGETFRQTGNKCTHCVCLLMLGDHTDVCIYPLNLKYKLQLDQNLPVPGSNNITKILLSLFNHMHILQRSCFKLHSEYFNPIMN